MGIANWAQRRASKSASAGSDMHPSVSRLSRLRDWLAIFAVVIGGAWAGVSFFYDRWIAPLLEPSVVHVEATTRTIGRSSCCILIEVEAKLFNGGKRSTYLHTSQIAIGAKSLSDLPPALPPSVVEQVNFQLRTRHEDAQLASEVPLEDIQYGPSRPTGSQFLVLAIGSLVEPGWALAPGESVVKRMALSIPEGYPFVAMRAKALVSHRQELTPKLVWHWSFNAATMQLGWLAWERGKVDALRNLVACTRGFDRKETERCRADLVRQGSESEKAFFAQDRHSYAIHYAADVMAWRPAELSTTR